MLPNKFTSNPIAELLPFSLLSENLFGYIPGICAMNYQLIILQDEIEVTQTSSSNADEFSVASQLAAAQIKRRLSVTNLSSEITCYPR